MIQNQQEPNNNIIRVLHVFGGLNAGGAESRTMDIYRNIDKSKVQFDFLIRKTGKQFFEDEIESLGGIIHRLPELKLSNIVFFLKKMKEFFYTNKYKIIHGHALSTAFIYFHYAKKSGIPIRIAHSRCDKQKFYAVKGLLRNILIKQSKFDSTVKLAVSKVAGNAAFGKRKVDSGEVIIWPNAIETKKYVYCNDTRINMRKMLEIENKHAIIHIGRFTKQKNHKFLISVFRQICNVNENFILILVGTGELEKKIKDYVIKKGLANKVMFLGVRKDVPQLLQAADVLCFPSFFEGLPGVVLEAQAAGLPSIISDKITKEVIITDYVKSVSLSKGTKYWSSEVIKAASIKRKDTSLDIINMGFDIEYVSKKYEKLYLDFSALSDYYE